MPRLLILLLLLPLFSEAQTLKSVKNRSKYLLEQYEVLAENDTIRAGSYKKMRIDTRELLEEGRYEANRRTGAWTFYNSKGTPELVYDYSTAQVITINRPRTKASLAQIQQGDTLAQVYLDVAPIYLASSVQIYSIIGREVRIPVQLQRIGIQEVSFKPVASVSPVGTSYRAITSHPDPEFKKSAREAMAMAFKGVEWLPAVYEGKPITSTYTFEDVVLTGYTVTRTQITSLPRLP